MKVLVTGVAGQLGHDVMNELAKRGYEGIGSDIAKSYNGIQDGTPVVSMPYVQMDITDKASVEKVLTEVNADAVIHCAAWTAVDLAEDEDKKDKVHAVNAEGTKNIAEVCKKLDSKMALIGRKHQVICITHLAQIAAMADHHFMIEKNVSDGQTKTSIRELKAEESTDELARILGGAKITDTVRQNAKEMQELAAQIKK